MKTPRDFSGWGYKLVHQSGSHIILEAEVLTHQRLSAPAHKSVSIGTLGNILRAVSAHKGVSRDSILKSIK